MGRACSGRGLVPLVLLVLVVAIACVVGAGFVRGWSAAGESASEVVPVAAARLSSLSSSPTSDDDLVVVVPRQSAGEAAAWRLREVSTERVGDGEVDVKTLERSGTVRVLEADEKILVLAWTESASPAGEIKPTLAGSTVELIVSREGQIQLVRNSESLRSALIGAIGEQARLKAERTGDAETAEVQAAIARSTLDSPGMLRAVVMRDVSPYFFGYGWKLGLGESLRFEDRLPNEFGTRPLPVLASCKIELEQAEGGGAGLYRMVFTQETDAERVPEIIRQSVDELRARNREVARAAGLDVGDEDENVETGPIEFSIRDDAVFEYDSASGWIRRVEWTRRALMGDLERTTVSTWDMAPMSVDEIADMFGSGAVAQERGMDRKTAFATFGAGCFWGVEVTFRNVPGVVDAAVGYTGGQVSNPTYRQVCSGNTGHAEVVHVEFDPAVVGFDALLEVFFRNHNPTTLNRQGPDIGTQYRSAIFYHSPEQKAEAERVMARMQAEFRAAGRFGGRAIVTTLEPFETFYRAEEYHQRYLEKRGLATCHTSDE